MQWPPPSVACRVFGVLRARPSCEGGRMTMTHGPGWYPEPSGQSGMRWWDGTRWTGHTAPARPPVDPTPPPIDPTPPVGTTRMKAWPWVVAGLGVLLLVLVGRRRLDGGGSLHHRRPG